MLIYLNKKAQSTSEYVMLFAVVLGAFALVNTNIKRRLAWFVDDKVKTTLQLGNEDLVKDPKATYRAGKEQENAMQKHEDVAGNGLYVTSNKEESKRASIAGNLNEVEVTVVEHNISAGDNSGWTPDVALTDKAEPY